MLKQISLLSASFVIALLIFMGIVIAYAWTEPSAEPPEGNVDSPINVGASTQLKIGGLGIHGVFETDSETNLAKLGGNVTVGGKSVCLADGTNCPASGGSGTVTSISAGTGITATPNPITNTGAISVKNNSFVCPLGSGTNASLKSINIDTGAVSCVNTGCASFGNVACDSGTCAAKCGMGNVCVMEFLWHGGLGIQIPAGCGIECSVGSTCLCCNR